MPNYNKSERDGDFANPIVIYAHKLGGGLVRPGVDPLTHTLKTITEEKSELHQGNAFIVSQMTALDAFDIAAPMTYYIVTPNTSVWSHITISGDANTAAYWELFEDDGDTNHFNVTGGALVTSRNRNRNNGDHADLLVYSGATVTTATIDARLEVGSLGKSANGELIANFVLKQNTKYLVKATSYADDNEGNLVVSWTEQINL